MPTRHIKLLAICMFLVVLMSTSNSFATGTWDFDSVILGINPNSNWQTGDEVKIKKTPLGSSGCQYVKFRPGFGNIPNTADGIAARNRIYATALAAFMSEKKYIYGSMM